MKTRLQIIITLSLLMLACPAHAQELLYKKWVNVFFESKIDLVKLDSASIRNKLKEPKLAEEELYFFEKHAVFKETFPLYDMELESDTVEEMHLIDYKHIGDSIHFTSAETVCARELVELRSMDGELVYSSHSACLFIPYSMKVLFLDRKCLALQSEKHIDIYFSKAHATEQDYVKYILLIQSMIR